MALQDIADKLAPELPWRTCATCHALDAMSDEDAQILRALLGNRAVRYKELAQLLADDPDSPTIPWEALSRHARGGCAARERLR